MDLIIIIAIILSNYFISFSFSNATVQCHSFFFLCVCMLFLHIAYVCSRMWKLEICLFPFPFFF